MLEAIQRHFVVYFGNISALFAEFCSPCFDRYLCNILRSRLFMQYFDENLLAAILHSLLWVLPPRFWRFHSVRIIGSTFIVSIIVLATRKWLLAICCSINLIWFESSWRLQCIGAVHHRIESVTYRQTHRQTDTLSAILRSPIWVGVITDWSSLRCKTRPLRTVAVEKSLVVV